MLKINKFTMYSQRVVFNMLKYFYINDNYLTIKPINSKGKKMKFYTYKLKYIGGGIEAKLYVTGVDLNEIKWIEIGPYKTKDGNPVIFEVK